MYLELFINGSYFNELDIDPEHIHQDKSFYYRVHENEENINAYILKLKGMFFKQICKCNSFEIVLVLQSKLNFFTENDIENETENRKEYPDNIRQIKPWRQVSQSR